MVSDLLEQEGRPGVLPVAIGALDVAGIARDRARGAPRGVGAAAPRRARAGDGGGKWLTR